MELECKHVPDSETFWVRNGLFVMLYTKCLTNDSLEVQATQRKEEHT